MEASAPIVKILAVWLKAFWPEVHERFTEKFAAGKTLDGDPGPWFARALLYKMQLAIHYDQNDTGITASFCCGSADNAYFELPQLGALF